MQDQAYTNPFVDVHEKVKAFKDRALQASKSDAEVREQRKVQEANELHDKVVKVTLLPS